MRVSIGRWFKSGSKEGPLFASSARERNARNAAERCGSAGPKGKRVQKFRYRESNPSLLGESQKS